MLHSWIGIERPHGGLGFTCVAVFCKVNGDLAADSAGGSYDESDGFAHFDGEGWVTFSGEELKT